jgi:hypothetical protein
VYHVIGNESWWVGSCLDKKIIPVMTFKSELVLLSMYIGSISINRIP